MGAGNAEWYAPNLFGATPFQTVIKMTEAARR